ncbi:MAG: peptidylprolyl isomerase [Marinifilaceae bacterium]
MVKRKAVSFLFVFLFCMLAVCSAQKDDRTLVQIQSNFGNIELVLYKDTPKHRKNFLQLIENKHFDGTLFYRVIKGFVLQGGSQDSRNAAPGALIGYGAANRTIESEFKPQYFHKKGALAAPRQPDKVNIFKESDVSQFYIAHGRVYSEKELNLMEKEVNVPLRKKIVKRYLTPRKRAILDSLKKEKSVEEFRKLANSIKSSINFDYNSDPGRLIFSPEQRKAYTTVGGVPHLDGNYTVFGEVVKGFDVIDRIAALKTDPNDRPYKDVTIKVKILKY